MLCFSVDSPDSLENIESKWVGEIAENCPDVKLVLVALKCDLRKREDDDAEGDEPETMRRAFALQRRSRRCDTSVRLIHLGCGA
jgi:GTPase SAR1 family protein